MTKDERMKEIAKASPNFGKRVGYKMCVVDELHDIKELEKEAERFVSEKSDKGNFDTEQFGKFNETNLVKFTEQRKVRTEIEINGVRFSSISDMLQYMDKLRDHIIDLEKENAELKVKYDICLRENTGLKIHSAYVEKKLAEAKELLREIIDTPVFTQMGGELYENEGYAELVEETEQFLKEIKEK